MVAACAHVHAWLSRGAAALRLSTRCLPQAASFLLPHAHALDRHNLNSPGLAHVARAGRKNTGSGNFGVGNKGLGAPIRRLSPPALMISETSWEGCGNMRNGRLFW